jgi:hypothetical protein
VLFTKYYPGDKIKEGIMARNCGMHDREKRYAYMVSG